MLNMTIKRQKKGLNKSQLARLSEIDAATISKIENGMLKPYPKQAERIAKILEVNPDELLLDVPEEINENAKTE